MEISISPDCLLAFACLFKMKAMIRAPTAPIRTEPKKMIRNEPRVYKQSLRIDSFSKSDLVISLYMTIPIASLKIDSPKTNE